MFQLFKNRNFTLLILGRLTANIGDSIYYIAAMWLVYELGGSTFYTGLAGFLTLLPQTLQFLVGPLVDRWPLRKTLFITQILQGTLILIIPLSAWMGWLNVSVVLTVMPIVSLIGQFAYPAQTATLPRVLAKEQLVKGNSLFSFAYQGADMIFNAIAGFLVAIVGAITLFLIDSIPFAIAAILFSTLKLPSRQKEKKSIQSFPLRSLIKRYIVDLQEGFHFVFKSIIAKMFIGSVIINFSLGAMTAILPAYADFRGGSEFYGLYLMAMSIGMLAGALIASLLENFPIGKLSIIFFLLGSIFWISSALVPIGLISVFLFSLAFIPIGSVNVILGAIGQRFIPQHLLARVFAVITSISTSIMPLGSLVGGTLSTLYGSTTIFIAAGFGIAFIAIVWLISSDLRQLPSVKEGDFEKYGLSRDISS